MRLRLTTVDEFQFLTCVQNQVWGSKAARFKDWKVGDYLALTVNRAVAGLAQVAGPPYVSDKTVWDNGAFPHRIPVKFVHLILEENRPPILGEIRDALTSVWGPNYGLGLLNQLVLVDQPAATIINAIQSCPNALTLVQSNIDQLLSNANTKRNLVAKPKTKLMKPTKPKLQPKLVKEQAESYEEESLHSKAQSLLIELGKITGCSVWIASNDRNRVFKGKPLGVSCLKALPNMGLNQEASNKISLIDIIWMRHNAPACAFEVEATTSIYSGLLRMSDLLALVPALNVKLFIVAPKERQTKVMAELARPTFRKIGLSEYCRFIAAEELEGLFAKVSGFAGHVQTSIVDTIAVELDNGVKGGLE